ncbi:hypothetical protein RHGRI_015841 [Rhododendron griersonianum]|uniref:ATPase AAA-type core domain-containing protein n=1 Tax=Rhododendron griersonianum TaxID=479676 RepID=A0AAV6JTC4_9ERIC|nr:hypothetical protein RHGRI_015841 [Rhododendron griersonianum]
MVALWPHELFTISWIDKPLVAEAATYRIGVYMALELGMDSVFEGDSQRLTKVLKGEEKVPVEILKGEEMVPIEIEVIIEDIQRAAVQGQEGAKGNENSLAFSTSSETEMTNEENMVKQHAKVAEEAVSGWEKAEAEALTDTVDEVDSFAVTRDNEMHEATRRILSVLLRQMDLSRRVIAATNTKQDLDPALISRFDSTIFFRLPNQQTRQEIAA